MKKFLLLWLCLFLTGCTYNYDLWESYYVYRDDLNRREPDCLLIAKSDDCLILDCWYFSALRCWNSTSQVKKATDEYEILSWYENVDWIKNYLF